MLPSEHILRSPHATQTLSTLLLFAIAPARCARAPRPSNPRLLLTTPPPTRCPSIGRNSCKILSQQVRQRLLSARSCRAAVAPHPSRCCAAATALTQTPNRCGAPHRTVTAVRDGRRRAGARRASMVGCDGPSSGPGSGQLGLPAGRAGSLGSARPHRGGTAPARPVRSRCEASGGRLRSAPLRTWAHVHEADRFGPAGPAGRGGAVGQGGRGPAPARIGAPDRARVRHVWRSVYVAYGDCTCDRRDLRGGMVHGLVTAMVRA